METKSKLKKGLFGKFQRKAAVLVILKKARSKSRTVQSQKLDKNRILVRTPHTNQKCRKKMKPVSKEFYMKVNPVSNITSEYITRKLPNDNIHCGDNVRYNVGNNNHRLQNIDLNPQLSKSFKRILSKRSTTRANISTGKTKQSQSIHEVKSKPMNRTKNRRVTEKSGINFKPPISINLQSMLTSGLENVDFSNLVRHVSFPTKSELAYGTINVTSKISDRNVSRIQTNVMSPTCADIFGYDEEEHSFSCSSIEQINCNNINQIKQQSSVGNESHVPIIQRNNFSAKSDSDNDSMGVNNNACKVDVTANSVCRNEIPKSSPSMKLKQERLKLMKGTTAISESTDLDPNEPDENPWILQKDVHKETDNISVSGYQSLGFAVNADSVIQPMSTDGRNLTRRDSQSSADSFSSGAVSVSEDALYFSDSEAEMQQEDDISSTAPVNLGRPQAKHHSSMYSMTDWNKLCSIDSLENISDDDNDEFALKKKLSSSNRLKETVSLGNIVAKLSKSKHMSNRNGVSLDSADENNLNLSIWKRRSLDDSKNMPPFIAAIVNDEPIVSACSVLSPVMESITAVPMRSQNRKQHNEKYNTISHIRKGKGRSYPEGNQQIKKHSRIESFSKILSKKSFTLGKNGIEFEHRRDKKDSDKPRFFKTHSLTSLVSKGAASLTSLITGSGRTNSSISVSSPFNQGRKKKPRAVEEATEFVYEKVNILQPRKRPANAHEITAAKKRLKLAHSVNNAESPTVGLYYTDSPNTKSGWSSAHSPTLLDEIMKSIDITRFCSMKLKQNAANSDIDDDSSSKSSGSMPIYKPYSASSDLIDLESASPTHMGVILISICRVCGKIKNSPETNSPVVEELSYTRHSTSLCDLNSNCSCIYTRPRVNSTTCGAINGTIKRYRNSTDLSLEQMNSVLSSVTLDSPRCVVPSASADWASNSHSSELAKESHLASRKNTSISMYELRDLPQLPFLHFDEIDTSSRDEKEHDEETQNYASRQSLPGSLLRHRPLLDLSADEIDSISDDELCIPVEPYDSLLSKSLGNIPGSTSQGGLSVHNDEERSHSCCNLPNSSSMSSDVVCAVPQFVSDTQVKKEERKIKVKSLSSSYDVLTSFTADDLHDIECDGVFDEKLRDKNIATTSTSTVFKRNDEFDSGVSNNSSGNVKNKCNISDKLNTSPVTVIYEPEQKSCIDVMSNISEYVERKCKQHGNYDQYNDKYSADFLPGLEICESCIKQKGQTTVRNIGKKTQNVQTSQKKPIHKLSPTAGRALVNIVCPICKNRRNGIHKMVSNNTYNDRKIKSDSQIYHVNSKTSINHTGKCNPILLSPESLVRFSPKDVAVRRALFGPLNDSHTHMPLTLPSEETSSDGAQRFAFDEQEVNKYLKFQSISQLKRLKSVSDDEVSYLGLQKKHKLGDKSWSTRSSSRLAALSLSQEIFSRLSFPMEMPSPLHDSPADTILWSPTFSKDFPESPVMSDVEEVCKYDISLGYLLHSLTCDNQTICVYSLQRNKQLMEGVITPIAALPGVAHPKSADSHHGNKQKSQTKTKQEDMPNPAAPITVVPSDKLLHASHVLRTVLLLRASHMIRDRKFHLRTYRRCMVGTEMVDWLLQQSSLVHSRTQAVGMWQALVEEGLIVHVCHEHQFKDKYLFYRFSEDDEGVGTVPTSATKKECEDELQHVFMMLAQIGPDAMMRMILRKLPHERTMEDLEIIYEELLHIKALSHLSTMVKRELASVLVFESHAKAGTVLFNQGDEGKSWYIILKGSVNVVIYGKGVVCTLHEGDDFGKLALVNDAPRAATIVLRDDNCHFLRVDKDDFNRILRDVEANTVRLKEHGQDVLVLEKIPSNTQSADGTVQAHYKYSIMAGTPEKMLEHLLESRLDNKGNEEIDGFLEDFLLTHVIFMPCNHLCPVLISNYHSSMSDSTEQEAFEFMLNHKKCVLHFVQEWANIVGTAFREDHTINAFLQELHSSVDEDLDLYPTLQDDLAALDVVLQSTASSPDDRPKRRPGLGLALGKKSPSRENMLDGLKKRKPKKSTDENIFKVYCADHTYSTLRLPMDTTVEQIIFSIRDKLCLGDDLVLCEVKSTGERVVCKENDLCVTSGLSINGCLFITPREHLDALTPLPEQEGPSQGSWYTIEMVSSKELAYHMTTYDWELFTCVQEYELIYQVFGRHKFHKITANLDLFLKRFNEIQFWVVTEMVLLTNLSKRVSLLRKFIKLASYCKDFQNLNSFFAIVMGLSNIAVSRLSQTWEKLPGKFKKMFADFETLMDPSRNHRVYRLSVAKMVPPIIPFMPLLMKDMTFTHEGNKTYFDGLVNFEKMHMIAQTLKTVRFCRSSNLDLEQQGPLKSADISGYIRNLQVIDNQRLLTQLSHKLEPRKT